MTREIPVDAIPTEWASSLCQEICLQSKNHWLSLAKFRCARCMTLYPTEILRRGFSRTPGNRGCACINARYEHYYWAFHDPEKHPV